MQVALLLGSQLNNVPQKAFNTPFEDTFIVSTEEKPFYYSSSNSEVFFNALIPIVDNPNYNTGHNIYFNAYKFGEQLKPFGGWLTNVTGQGEATFIDSVTNQSRTVSFKEDALNVWNNGINYSSANMGASVSFYSPISMNLAGGFGVTYRVGLQPSGKNGGRLLPSFKPFYTIRRDAESFNKPSLFYTENTSYPEYVYWSLNFDGYNLSFEGSDGSSKTFYPQISPDGESYIFYPVQYFDSSSMRVSGATYGVDTREVAESLFYFGDYFGGFNATLNPVHAFQAFTSVGEISADFSFVSNRESFNGVNIGKNSNNEFIIDYYGANGYTRVFTGKNPTITANRVTFEEIQSQDDYKNVFVPFQPVDITYFNDKARFVVSAVFGGNELNYNDFIIVYGGEDVFSLIGKAFVGIGGIFSIMVLPNITLGTVFLIPLFVIILLFILGLFKR